MCWWCAEIHFTPQVIGRTQSTREDATQFLAIDELKDNHGSDGPPPRLIASLTVGCSLLACSQREAGSEPLDVRRVQPRLWCVTYQIALKFLGFVSVCLPGVSSLACDRSQQKLMQKMLLRCVQRCRCIILLSYF